MRIFLHPKAYNFLIKQDKDISRRIKDKLKELGDNPRLGEHLNYFGHKWFYVANVR
jgi:mRNA-degrading endonuclease RelE of RelBE toxin-antitoxin system